MVLPALSPTPSGIDADAWAEACASVRRHCRWHIAPTITETITIEADGSPQLLVETLHLLDVQNVTVDGLAVDFPRFYPNGVVKPGFLIDPDRLGSYYWAAGRDVTLTITHGYPVCPDEVFGILVASATARVPAVLAGKGQMTAGPFGADFSESHAWSFLTAEQRAVLDDLTIPDRP